SLSLVPCSIPRFAVERRLSELAQGTRNRGLERPTMLCLTCPTSPRWLDAALADLDRVLADHAHCEMKAASNALSLATRFPEAPRIVRALVRLAEEELAHYRAVLDELERRGIPLGTPPVDAYAAELRKLAASLRPRGGRDALVDRLLVAATIEAR